MTTRHLIYITKLEDGSYLAISTGTPRFCVGASTLELVKEKAVRALDYHYTSTKKPEVAPKEIRVIRPFYEREELCSVKI